MKVDRDGLVEVTFEDERGAELELGPAPLGVRTPWSGRAWSRVAASIAVLLTVSVLVQDASLVRSVTRLGEVTGLSGSLAGPFVERWRVEAGGVLGVVGDLLLLQDGPSGTGVIAVSLAAGSPVWQRESELGYCAVHGLTDGPGSADLPPVIRREPREVRVVCRAYTGSPSGSQDRVQVLDPLTGRTVLDVPWTSSGGGGLYAAGDGLIGYAIDLRNRVVVARWSLVTGQREWFYTGGEALAVPTLDLADERIVLSGDGTVAVDLRTGAVVPDDARPVVVLGPFDLPDGGTAVTQQRADGGQDVVVRDPSGAVRFRRPGSLAVATVQDPGARDVLLLSVNGGLVGVDARTGRSRWSVPTAVSGQASSDVSTFTYPLVSVAGLVVVGGSGAPVALDARTGTQRWVSPLQGGGGPVPCDGYRVAFVDVGPVASSLVVLGLRDGREVRRQELPFAAPSQLIALPGGLLAQVTGTDVAVLAAEPPAGERSGEAGPHRGVRRDEHGVVIGDRQVG